MGGIDVNNINPKKAMINVLLQLKTRKNQCLSNLYHNIVHFYDAIELPTSSNNECIIVYSDTNNKNIQYLILMEPTTFLDVRSDMMDNDAFIIGDIYNKYDTLVSLKDFTNTNANEIYSKHSRYIYVIRANNSVYKTNNRILIDNENICKLNVYIMTFFCSMFFRCFVVCD